MNKTALLKLIKSDLTKLRDVALKAAADAHHIATHKENVAENKYDTLGLEAAYLAHGQSKRVSEYESAIIAYNQLSPTDFNENTPATLGALINLIDENNNLSTVFLGPLSGGETIRYNDLQITLITLAAPLGKALQGCFVGDEITVMIAGNAHTYEITGMF